MLRQDPLTASGNGAYASAATEVSVATPAACFSASSTTRKLNSHGPGCDTGAVAAPLRLVTVVDLNDDVADAHHISVSARHEAELVNGRRVLLLDDRGWTSSLGHLRVDGIRDGDSSRGNASGIWATTSVQEIEDTARVVVGPDEPFDDLTQEDTEANHWAYLVGVLRQQGVVVDARELRRLPHDVVLTARLLARVGPEADRPRSP